MTAEKRASDYFLWDDEMPGFGLRVLPSGRKAWVAQYRIGGRGGRTRRVSFGYAGTMTPDEARKEARDVLAKAGKGGDPAAAIVRRVWP